MVEESALPAREPGKNNRRKTWFFDIPAGFTSSVKIWIKSKVLLPVSKLSDMSVMSTGFSPGRPVEIFKKVIFLMSSGRPRKNSELGNGSKYHLVSRTKSSKKTTFCQFYITSAGNDLTQVKSKKSGPRGVEKARHLQTRLVSTLGPTQAMGGKERNTHNLRSKKYHKPWYRRRTVRSAYRKSGKIRKISSRMIDGGGRSRYGVAVGSLPTSFRSCRPYTIEHLRTFWKTRVCLRSPQNASDFPKRFPWNPSKVFLFGLKQPVLRTPLDLLNGPNRSQHLSLAFLKQL